MRCPLVRGRCTHSLVQKTAVNTHIDLSLFIRQVRKLRVFIISHAVYPIGTSTYYLSEMN